MTAADRLKLIKAEIEQIDKQIPELWMPEFITSLTQKREALLQDAEILEGFLDAKADDLPEKERKLNESLSKLKTNYEEARQSLTTAEAEIARLKRLKQLIA